MAGLLLRAGKEEFGLHWDEVSPGVWAQWAQHLVTGEIAQLPVDKELMIFFHCCSKCQR